MAAVEDYDFFEPLPAELTCPICMKVLSEPHLVNCCERYFCKGCLDKWSQNDNTCPHCRSTDFSHMLLKQQSRKIGELKVYCPNKKHGCKSVLKISECGDHLSATNDKGCSYVKLNCPFNCKTEVFRADMASHTQKQCPKRCVTCIHCKLTGKHEFITGNHINRCQEYPLLCPQGCGLVIRKDLETHHDICPLKPVSCPFNVFGCKTQIPRKDLEKHIETNMLHHMTTLAKSHATLKEEHVMLQADHKALKKDYIALKKSHTAKLKAITPLLKDHPKDSVTSKIYTILAESSSVTLGEELKLALPESNKSDHHYIILAEPGQLEYKFKLEWKTPDASTSEKRRRFLLYTKIRDIHPLINFTVNLSFDNCWQESPYLNDPKCIAEICCGNPLKEVSVSESVDKSLRLLGKLDLNPHKSDQHLYIKFVRHEEKECPCTSIFCACHQPRLCFGKQQPTMSQPNASLFTIELFTFGSQPRSKPPASVSWQPLASMLQQPASVLQQPASMSQPPTSVSQLPASVLQPPASVLQPPANSVAQPPASLLQPPVSAPQPPASMSQPLASVLQSPKQQSTSWSAFGSKPLTTAPINFLPLQLGQLLNSQSSEFTSGMQPSTKRRVAMGRRKKRRHL